MEIIKLTKAQVIAKLETEPLFILRFAVDNNPNGVIGSLNANGIATAVGTNPDTLYNTLVQILKTDKAKAVQIISPIRYNPLVPIDNYTYGLTDYLRNIQPASTVTGAQKFSVDALLGGLGAGLTAYTDVSTSGGGLDGQPKLSQAEIDAKAKADAEAKKKKTTQIIIWGVVVLVVVSVVIYFATKKKKTS